MGLYRRRWRNSDGKHITSPQWWMAYMIRGEQHCESTGTSNKRVAQKILDIRRAEIAEGRFAGLLKSHPPTFRDYLSKYLVSRTNLHPNTRVRYAVSQRALESFFGSARLPDLTDAAVEAYKTARVEGGTGPSGVSRPIVAPSGSATSEEGALHCPEPTRRP